MSRMWKTKHDIDISDSCLYIVYILVNYIDRTLNRTPVHCPSCAAELAVTRLVCGQCHTEVSGHYDLSPLLRLASDDQAFVEAFVTEKVTADIGA